MLPSLSNLALHTSRVRTGGDADKEQGINDQLLADMEKKKALNALRRGRPRSSSRSSQAARPASDDEAESTRATDTTETDDTVGTNETKASNASESANDDSDDDSSEDEMSESSHLRFLAIATKLKSLKKQVDFINDYIAVLDGSIETFVRNRVDEVEAGFQGDLVEASNRLDEFVSDLTANIKDVAQMYEATDRVVEVNRQRIAYLETQLVEPKNGILLSEKQRVAVVRANEMLKELLREIRGEQTSS